jgi:hypothetical protein
MKSSDNCIDTLPFTTCPRALRPLNLPSRELLQTRPPPLCAGYGGGGYGGGRGGGGELP